MPSPTVLVTGGSGLLGRHLKPLLPDALFPEHAEFDVTDPSKMAGYLDGRNRIDDRARRRIYLSAEDQ